jgi:hypothetical protein
MPGPGAVLQKPVGLPDLVHRKAPEAAAQSGADRRVRAVTDIDFSNHCYRKADIRS